MNVEYVLIHLANIQTYIYIHTYTEIRLHSTTGNEGPLREELKYIRSKFNEINNYEHWGISKVFK